MKAARRPLLLACASALRMKVHAATRQVALTLLTAALMPSWASEMIAAASVTNAPAANIKSGTSES